MMLRLKEGYWYTPHTPKLPQPVHKTRRWKGQADFIRLLGRVEMRASTKGFTGHTSCRICFVKNGSTEFYTEDWQWPAGLLHYIKVHNHRPSDEFMDYIKAYARNL